MSLTLGKSEAYSPPIAHLEPYRFKPGQTGNPGGRTKLHAECRRLAREICPDAINRIAQIMRQTDDDRAALIAAQTILDRGLGKVKDTPEDERQPLDLSQFPPAAIALIRQAMSMMAPAASASSEPVQEVLPPES